jgi:hypothetical protein
MYICMNHFFEVKYTYSLKLEFPVIATSTKLILKTTLDTTVALIGTTSVLFFFTSCFGGTYKQTCNVLFLHNLQGLGGNGFS